MTCTFLALGEIFRIKYISSQKNDGIFHIFYLIKISRVRFTLGPWITRVRSIRYLRFEILRALVYNQTIFKLTVLFVLDFSFKMYLSAKKYFMKKAKKLCLIAKLWSKVTAFWNIDKTVKSTCVINRALPSLHYGLLEITVTALLNTRETFTCRDNYIVLVRTIESINYCWSCGPFILNSVVSSKK